MRRTLWKADPFLCSSSRRLHSLDRKSYSLNRNGKLSSKNSDCNAACGFFPVAPSLPPSESKQATLFAFVKVCSASRLEDATEYFELCRNKLVGINAMFYASLVDGLGKAVRELKMQTICLKKCSSARDSYCCKAIMDSLAKRGKIDQTVCSYTILIDGLFKEAYN
ncbi:Pentatricopeptide repeat-containing protein, mitochondrial, partial [Cucurbita argyrosperma subsp. sororia]